MLLGYSLFPSESGLKKVSVLFLFLFYNLCGDSILTDIAVVEWAAGVSLKLTFPVGEKSLN